MKKDRVEERRHLWARSLEPIIKGGILQVTRPQPYTGYFIREITPSSTTDPERGFHLRDKQYYLLIKEAWLRYEDDDDYILVKWKYQFSKPDGGCYSGKFEWVFRYDFNALATEASPVARQPHLNVHHPRPIEDHIHYPVGPDPWAPSEFVDFLVYHFPSLRDD